jgi:hypothetical protein
MHARLPAMEGRLPAPDARPLLYVGLSGDYAAMFADGLISSALVKSPGLDIHVHLMNPGEFSADRAFAAFPPERVSWTLEQIGPCSKTVYAARRFVRLSQALAESQRTIVSLDADSLVNGDITEALEKIGRFDVLIYDRPDEMWVQQMINASFFALAPTRIGQDFIDFVAAYILHFETRGTSRWFVDQLAIISARAWFSKNVKNAVIKSAPSDFLDWSGRDASESLIRTAKGMEKKKMS